MLSVYIELSKMRILVMQLVTLSIGYVLAANPPVDWERFGMALLGTALVSAGAGALNHCFERDIDAKMKRTQDRPIPTGQISFWHAAVFGIFCTWIGLAILLMKVNMLTAVLAFVTSFLYLVVYTPMKRLSWFNTLVGAIPGAIPPLGGWAAATGYLSLEAWILFAILFVWQLPHFYAIAWMYREDYKNAGLKMLSVMDPDGARTSRQILAQSLLLICVSIYPYMIGMMGELYLAGALFLGLYFLRLGWAFRHDRSFKTAKRVLLGSVIYLPALLLVILIDRFLVFT